MEEKSTSSREIRILGIGGTMRADSLSLKALQAALSLAAERGAQTVLADVRELDLPMYNPERALESYPSTLPWLMDEVRKADALILCSPSYHGTITGVLKNVLDALNFLNQDEPRYFGGKVVGLMALGANSGNVLNDLHHSTRGLNGLSAPRTVLVPGQVIDRETGEITDVGVTNRLTSMVEQVIDLAKRLRPS